MKLPYRLLAMDLDGTALGADPAQFAPDVLEAAQEAAARGVTVVFATGRPLSVLPPIIREGSLPWLRYLVLNDGAQIWDRQEKRWLWQQAWSRSVSITTFRWSSSTGRAATTCGCAGTPS